MEISVLLCHLSLKTHQPFSIFPGTKLAGSEALKTKVCSCVQTRRDEPISLQSIISLRASHNIRAISPLHLAVLRSVQGLAMCFRMFPHTCSVFSSSSTRHLASPAECVSCIAACFMPNDAYWMCSRGIAMARWLLGIRINMLVESMESDIYTIQGTCSKSDLVEERKKAMCISRPRLSTCCAL